MTPTQIRRFVRTGLSGLRRASVAARANRSPRGGVGEYHGAVLVAVQAVAEGKSIDSTFRALSAGQPD
jgi:hypothetical protein